MWFFAPKSPAGEKNKITTNIKFIFEMALYKNLSAHSYGWELCMVDFTMNKFNYN